MIAGKQFVSEPVHATGDAEKAIEIVVPFTGEDLTQAALDEADKLVGQLNGKIRVIAIQTVPIARPLDHPPVSSHHLEQILRKLLSRTPAVAEIYLVRDPEQTWAKLLQAGSLIVIASRKRIWRTREEGLAKLLQGNGQEIVLIYPRTKRCSI